MIFGFFQNMGPWQLIICIVVIGLLFGGKKIPELARSLGKAKGEFKKGIAEGAAEADEEEDEAPRKVSKKKKVQEIEADTDASDE